ncbi:MAG: hypothetical protein A2583_10315 [Bdellovibrionales bacterium RIFOXYD1_FULL_53_11]|nr:MAG: hypothetical protein A2583_10315 [Bdellovibrionales bacterium RIFOXYD1_FULL_53_11]
MEDITRWIVLYLRETATLGLQMAPWLLLGFLVAGILHVLIPKELLVRHLSRRGFGSVFKAAIIGVPLPLCSCSVIPVSAHLEKNGANRGAIISFLSSTPATGVDSIFATYALLGPVFAILRPLIAFMSGIISGTVVNYFEKPSVPAASTANPEKSCHCREARTEPVPSIKNPVHEIFHYGFVVLPRDIAKWLVIGIAVGGLISTALPTSFIENYLGNHALAYLVMLAIGIPMYVCSTGSIPIAAALMAKGLSPGAALVFLIAGPATNTATIAFIAGKYGKKTLAIYLGTIAVIAIVSAILLDSMK